jgi:predicted nucleic acid-binding protein
MIEQVLLDTGPLVASINRNDRFYAWARMQLAQIEPPMLTCEAVLAETCHLLRRCDGGMLGVLEFLQRGIIEVPFRFRDDIDPVSKLMRKYANIPMSFADACLVRMSEHYDKALVMTLDSDFRHYRRHGRQVVPVLMPLDRQTV